jgi:Zn-dependent M28 family amino/carboxypeptidase
MAKKPAAVLVSETTSARRRWSQQPESSVSIASQDQLKPPTVVYVDKSEFAKLTALADGSQLKLSSPSKTEEKTTWNTVGKIEGQVTDEAILFTAHHDAIGPVAPVKGDSIVNGADDDASGVVTVLELARYFSQQKKPRRTLYFVTFGSEELGLIGSQAFLAKPTFDLKTLVANLEFEMLGRPDPKMAEDQLWLTGFDYSNLGPELVKQGAKLAKDPYPDQHFFERSDNFALARTGVVAQTVSSFGLHNDYHAPSDDISKIDFKHMETAVGSLLKSTSWLANTTFKPSWNEGKDPSKK